MSDYVNDLITGMGYTYDPMPNNEKFIRGTAEVLKETPKIIKSIPKSIAATTAAAIGGLKQEFGDQFQSKVIKGGKFTYEPTGEEFEIGDITVGQSPELVKWGKQISHEGKMLSDVALKDQMELAKQFDKDSPSKWVYDNLSSVANSLSLLGAGIVTGGFTTIPMFIAQKQGLRYDEFKRAGLSTEEAEKKALPSAVFEGITEWGTVGMLKGIVNPAKWGVSKLVDPKKWEMITPEIKKLSNTLGAYITDMFGEHVMNMIDQKIDDGVYNTDTPLLDVIKDNIGSIAFQSGIIAGGVHAGSRLVEVGNQIQYKAVDAIGENKTLKKIADQIITSEDELKAKYEREGVSWDKWHPNKLVELNNTRGTVNWFNDLVNKLVFNNEGLRGTKIVPNVGDSFDQSGVREGQSVLMQYDKGVPFNADILKVVGNDIYIHDGKDIRIVPKGNLSVVQINGEHERTLFKQEPYGREEINNNPDTMYVFLSALGKGVNVKGNNIGIIDINDSTKEYMELNKLFKGVTDEEVKRNISKLGPYIKLDNEIEKLKRQFTGIQISPETYTFNVTKKTFDNINRFGIDRAGGIVSPKENIGYTTTESLPDTPLIELEDVDIKTSHVRMTEVDSPVPKAKRRIVAGKSKDIKSHWLPKGDQQEYGPSLGEVIKLNVAEYGESYWKIKSIEPSKYKGKKKYILEPFTVPVINKFNNIAIYQSLGNTNHIDLKTWNKDFYRYFIRKLHELNSFVDKVNKNKEVPKSIVYNGRDIVVNGIHSHASNGDIIYDTEIGMIREDGKLLRDRFEEENNRPKRAVFVNDVKSTSDQGAMIKPDTTLGELKVGDLISIENYNENQKPIQVRITRKIDDIVNIIGFKFSDDKQWYNPINRKLAEEISQKLGKKRSFLGQYFKPGNKIGDFYPSRQPHSYIEFDIVDNKSKRGVQPIPERKKVKPIPFRGIKGIEPIGDIQTRDVEQSEWTKSFKQSITNFVEKLQIDEKDNKDFDLWQTDITAAIYEHNYEDAIKLIEEGGSKFMDKEKILRMVEAIEQGIGFAPHELTLIDWFIQNGANVNFNTEISKSGRYMPKEIANDMGFDGGGQAKASHRKFVLPIGRALLNGKWVQTIAFGEEQKNEENVVEGYSEAWFDSDILNNLYDEHLQSAINAFESGKIDCMSSLAKRLFFEHPELYQTEYSKPYRDYLNNRIKNMVKKTSDISDKVYQNMLIKARMEIAREESESLYSKSMVNAAKEAANNIESYEDIKSKEERKENLIEEKETRDVEVIEESFINDVEKSNEIIDSLTRTFLDTFGEKGEVDLTPLNHIIKLIRTPGWIHSLTNKDFGALGVDRLKFDKAIGLMRANIDNLSDLANSTGNNTYDYFHSILVSRGFTDDEAFMFASFFLDYTLPKLVEGMKNKALAKIDIERADSRIRGYSTYESRYEKTELFWDSIKDGFNDIKLFAEEVLKGSNRKTKKEGESSIGYFFAEVPPDFRIFIRERILTMSNPIRAKEAEVRHILFNKMSHTESQLAVDLIEANASREDIFRDQATIRANVGQQELMKMIEEADKKIQSVKDKINHRNVDSIMNIYDCMSSYKILTSRTFDEQVARKKVYPNQKREFYLHHQVVEYTEDWMVDKVFYKPSKITKTPIRGYTMHRTFNGRPLHKFTPESLVSSIMNPYVDNLVEDILNEVFHKFDYTRKFVNDHVTLDAEQNVVPDEDMKRIINVDDRGNFQIKEGTTIDINGEMHIAVPKTYYTLKFEPFKGIDLKTGEEVEHKMVSGEQQTWLIPLSVHRALSNLTHRGNSWADRFMRTAQKFTRGFKHAAILSVWPVFQFNNMLGDSFMLSMLAENRLDIVGHLGFGLKYSLKKYSQEIGVKKFEYDFNEREKKLELWMNDHGILDATSLAEIRLSENTNNLFNNFLSKLEKTGEMRENVLRVAFAASMYDQFMYATEEQIQKVIDSYSWVPHMEESTNNEAKLANIARTLCTDYMRQSENFKGIVSNLTAPFAQWFLRNAGMSIRKMFHSPSHIISMGAIISTPAIFAALWNLSDPRREYWETMLQPNIRNSFHLIFPQKDGTANIWSPQLPVDVLPLINTPGLIISTGIRVLHGEIQPKEGAKQILPTIYEKNKEVFYRLMNPLVRFFRGVYMHQDPYDRAKIFPHDIKNMTPMGRARYLAMYFAKCCVPLMGNYVSKEGMKHEHDAFKNTMKPWNNIKTILGVREGVLPPMGIMMPSTNKNLITSSPSKVFIGSELIAKDKELSNRTLEIRTTLLDTIRSHSLSDPESKKEIQEAYKTAINDLSSIYPKKDLPQVLSIFMKNLARSMRSPDVFNDILKNEKAYQENLGNDMEVARLNSAQVVARNMIFLKDLKGISKEAKTQLPNIIKSIQEGHPSNPNEEYEDLSYIGTENGKQTGEYEDLSYIKTE